MNGGTIEMKYNHIIVGAGSMGSAAAYFLGKQGRRVLLIDAFTPPHNEGSHHGDTRLIRFAYGEGEKYVPFVLRAKKLWDEIASLSGMQNFLQTGIINVGHRDDVFIQSVKHTSDKFGLPLQSMNAEQIMEKWPGISIPNDFVALYETDSGVMLTKPAIEGYLHEAFKYDVTPKFNSPVNQINVLDGKAIVTIANGEQFEADNCIITVGAWAKQLLDETGLNLPVQATRKTFAWFEAPEELYCESLYPGFTFQFGNESYYGFPSIDRAGLKVGRHDGGQVIHPSDAKAPFGTIEGDLEDLQRFLASYMPSVGDFKEGKTCMYAMTPDEDFIIDSHPIHKEIILAAGFSGHGFKFASAVGEALSEMAQNQPTTIDLTPFRLSRFDS